jgi:hypothetical protein
MTCLINACRNNDFSTAWQILDSGTLEYLEIKDQFGYTALIWAIRNGNRKITYMLLEAGADPNAKNDWRQPALSFACIGGHVEIADMLLEAGAKIGAKDILGLSATDLANGKRYKDLERIDEIKDLLKKFPTRPVAVDGAVPVAEPSCGGGAGAGAVAGGAGAAAAVAVAGGAAIAVVASGPANGDGYSSPSSDSSDSDDDDDDE